MAFNAPNSISFGGPSNVVSARNDDWKAQAFINIRIKTRKGNMRQIAGIPLRASDPYHAQIIEHLSSGTEEEIQDKLIDLFSKFEVDFRLAEADSDDGLDLE